MKQGSWLSIITIYCFGVLAVAGLGRILPLNISAQNLFGVDNIQFAWIFGLIGIPSLLLSIPLGMLVDNYGPKIILLCGAIAAIFGDIAFGSAQGIIGLQIGRIFDGIAISSIYSSGPALLMASTTAKRQVIAMTLWSTCAPVGFALGLIVGGNFSNPEAWQNTFIFHGAAFLAIVASGLFLPNIKPNNSKIIGIRKRIIELFSAYKNVPLLILVLGHLFNSSVGFGVNSVLPMYISKMRNIDIHQTSQLVAGTSLFMILGSLGIGAFLARNFVTKKLEAIIAILAITTGFVIFNQNISLGILPIFLSVWFILMGGSTTIIFASLPKFSEVGRLGASSGLINQASSISTIITPPIWFGLMAIGNWIFYPGLIVLSFIMIASSIWIIYSRLEKKS